MTFFGLRRTLAFVKREKADRNMLIVLIGFALTVALTRLFLELSGYPQLGNSTLHIAHLLWGGLALFVGILIAIIFDHRHVYPIVAILGGVGMGLFIDEIGKFITQANDYFYPMAAPIIYAFFLLTLLVYLYVRRPLEPTPRGELYRAFELIKEALDHELDQRERAELQARLGRAAKQGGDPNLAHVAEFLLQLVASDALTIRSMRMTVWQRIRLRWHKFEEQWVPPALHRGALVGGLIASSLFGLTELYNTSDLFLNPRQAIPLYIQNDWVGSANQAYWLMLSVGMDGLIGLVLVISAVLFLLRRARWAAGLGFFSLLFTLSTANVISVYFKQFTFATIAETTLELSVLWVLVRFRRRHLDENEVG